MPRRKHTPPPDPIEADTPAATQPPLFDDLVAPFNFEGAYLEVEQLTVEVDRLARRAADDKTTAKASTEAWTAAASQLHALTLDLRRRRLAKAAQSRTAGGPTQAASGTCSRRDCEATTTITPQADNPYAFDEVCPVHGLQGVIAWATAGPIPAYTPTPAGGPHAA